MRYATGGCPRPAPGFGLALLALLIAASASGAAATGDSSRTAPAAALRLPADIVLGRAGGPDSVVVFSHQTHVQFAGNRCTGCHPAPFHMLQRGPAPSHREMNAGGSCGRCHDGRQAFSVRDSAGCHTCHSGRRSGQMAVAGAAGPAPRSAPKPHTYPRSGDSPGSVTFRHEGHLRGAAGCAACHPKPFRMAAGPPLPAGGMHEAAACGACHDGRQAFATDNPDACSRCHRESGARP